MGQDDVYAGVDVGSSSIRVAVLDDRGEILFVETERLDYHQSKIDPKFVTQSSSQIWSGYTKCMGKIKSLLGDKKIRSVGCAATCSMVVMQIEDDGKLAPYSADYGFTDPDQNIVFWMDSRAAKETKEINEALKGDIALDYMGGSFIQEMGLPKVKYLVDHIPKQDLDKIVFFDLHDFLTYNIAGEVDSVVPISTTDLGHQVAIDGELKGWHPDILRKIGLEQLITDDFKAIGRIEQSFKSSYLPIPLAGSKVAVTPDGISVSQGLIDCYAGWIASCGKSLPGSMTMIAGTSTCYLLATRKLVPVKGVWGPFANIFNGYYAFEGGQSTTGKLIEHLFETHPAFNEIQNYGPDVFNTIEEKIQEIEAERGCIHFLAKNVLSYGDLSGNRTPYSNGEMRGAFIGESTDTSVYDFILKYVSILEFLAMQARLMRNLLGGDEIEKIIISGSQAKNKRLVKLISSATMLPVEVSKRDPEFSGVKGAAYLGIAACKNIQLTEVISSLNDQGTVYEPDLVSDEKLIKLLDVKYEIMKDMAERQITYRKWVAEALE